MKMKHLSLLLLSAMLCFSGCGEAKKEQAKTQTEVSQGNKQNAEAQEVKSQYPMTVTDQIGREVTIEKEPSRLVSGYYISTSALIGLDLEDKLVGVEAKAEKRALYKKSASKLLDLAQVGSLKAFDLEGCIALKPDLVILAAKQKDSIKALEDAKITVLAVNPETEADMKGMLSLLAKACNKEDKAEKMLAFIQEKKEMVASLTAGEEKPGVYLAGNADFLQTAGEKMFQSALIEEAGASNVAKELEDNYWAQTSYEQVLSWNPQYIILASDATYTEEDVLKDANLANVDAVVNQRVYKMPSAAEAWDSPVPASVLGSVWLAGVLHEEKVGKDAYLEVAKEYYEKFYGFTYDEK